MTLLRTRSLSIICVYDPRLYNLILVLFIWRSLCLMMIMKITMVVEIVWEEGMGIRVEEKITFLMKFLKIKK